MHDLSKCKVDRKRWIRAGRCLGPLSEHTPAPKGIITEPPEGGRRTGYSYLVEA